jgi:hypothetical protein
MSHEHIRPTRTGAWCIPVPTGTAKMEIPDKGYHSNQTMVVLEAVGMLYIAEPDRSRRD